MIQMVNESRALGTVNKYLYLIEKTGYVRPATMKKYMAYLFMVDFVNYAHSYFDEKDYVAVDSMLKRLFTNGGCLLPYKVFCTNRAKLGKNEYMGTMKIRFTEDNLDRSTENDYLRTI